MRNLYGGAYSQGSVNGRAVIARYAVNCRLATLPECVSELHCRVARRSSANKSCSTCRNMASPPPPPPPPPPPIPPSSEADGDSTALPTDALADRIAALERAVGIRPTPVSGSTTAPTGSTVVPPSTGKAILAPYYVGTHAWRLVASASRMIATIII